MPKQVRFGSDALIYCNGDKADKIFLLQQGKVWLTYPDLETGGETADIVGPGEFFGIKSALARFPREESALAKNSAVVLAFAPAEFEQLLLANDRLVMKMLKVFSDQLRRVHCQISSITKTQYVKPDYGLFEIGEKYMKHRRYSHAKYIFRRYFELYPDGENAGELKGHIKTLAGASPQDDKSRAAISAPASKPAEEDSLQLCPELFARFSRSYAPGEIVFSEYEPGNTFYFIQSGEIKLIKNAGQNERTLDVLQQSEIFGEMAILDKSPRTASAFAINEATLLEFTAENFEILMRGNPQIAIKLLRALSKRISHAKRRFMILTLPDPQTKIADVFLMLDETGDASMGKAGFYSREFKVTMDGIAHWAGLPAADVKSVLDYYAAQRRVSIYQDRIEVKNINDFSRVVSSSRRSRD